MVTRRDGEWTKPPVLLNIVSIILLVIGGYLATQRDDGAKTERRFDAVAEVIGAHNSRMVILETKQEILWRERDDHELEQRGR